MPSRLHSLFLYGFSAGLLLLTAHPARTETGTEILRETGTSGGLVVHLGCGDGQLTAQLCPGEGYLVQGLDDDPEAVQQARQYIQSLGLDGKVSVERLSGKALPYADNLVNLIVISDKSLGVSAAEIQRVLRPNGTAITLDAGLSTLDSFRKPWPAEIDEWTHFRYSAEGNMVSHDEIVGPPQKLQWAAEPIFQRHHGVEPSITATVSAGGRIFYIIDEAPVGFTGMPGEWRLVARDAFNGVLLWKRDISNWGSYAWSYWTESHAARFNHPLHVRKRLIADGDRVYVTLGFDNPIEVLDAATGETVRTFEGTDYADEFVLHDGVLFAAVNDGPQRPWPGRGVRPEPTERRPPSKKQVWAIDAASGRVNWKAGPFYGCAAKIDRMASMRHLNLTASQDGVYLIDEKQIVGLDRESGDERWRIDRAVMPQPPEKRLDVGLMYHLLQGENVDTLIWHDGRLFILYPTTSFSMKHTSVGVLQALDAGTGKELWRYDAATPIAYIDWPDVFAIGETVWVPDRKAMTLIGLDAATGEEKVVHSIEKALKVGHHHRCYPNRASVNYAVLGRRGAEFVNWETGELTLHHWLRTGCRSGHVLANGLLYRPPDHCQCYMSFQPRGFLAMSPQEGSDPTNAPSDAERLVKGPAYDSVPTDDSASAETDWPTYRHDAMRSSMATCQVPGNVEPAWQADLPAQGTPPVVAEGRVFVASTTTHQVLAFDAASGQRLWDFVAGGPIDSPPTAWQGRILFGCRDGRVYCLRAADGALAWRFEAAPQNEYIVAFGQLESRWPVCGSVLVSGGTVYAVAGRTSLLDGGVVAYALDAATGKVLDKQSIREVQTETRTTGLLPEGALNDILTTDGTDVYLRNRKLELEPAVQGDSPAELAETRPRLTADGGFANQRWFHRAFWQFKSSVGGAKGNLIAFDAKRAYVAAANLPGGPNQTFHIPAGGATNRIAGVDGDGPSWLAYPNLQIGGSVLFAAKSRTDRAAEEVPDPRGDRYGKSSSRPAPAAWRQNHFPVYPWAMIAAGERLVVAGPTAELQPHDPWAVFEGRAGGQLHVLDSATGEAKAQLTLPAPPVWNGMAAAGGRLYLTTQDGQLICLGGK